MPSAFFLSAFSSYCTIFCVCVCSSSQWLFLSLFPFPLFFCHADTHTEIESLCAPSAEAFNCSSLKLRFGRLLAYFSCRSNYNLNWILFRIIYCYCCSNRKEYCFAIAHKHNTDRPITDTNTQTLHLRDFCCWMSRVSVWIECVCVCLLWKGRCSGKRSSSSSSSSLHASLNLPDLKHFTAEKEAAAAAADGTSSSVQDFLVDNDGFIDWISLCLNLFFIYCFETIYLFVH